MMSNSSIQIVEKEEQIRLLNFPKEEILVQREDQNIRFDELKKAISSCYLKKEKVKIFFADDSGLKKIETLVSAITEESVVLKQSTHIPLQRIISVT